MRDRRRRHVADRLGPPADRERSGTRQRRRRRRHLDRLARCRPRQSGAGRDRARSSAAGRRAGAGRRLLPRGARRLRRRRPVDRLRRLLQRQLGQSSAAPAPRRRCGRAWWRSPTPAGLGGCASATPLGFLNPSLYSIAAGSGAAAALRRRDDAATTTRADSARYPATTGYDMATGLGTPIATDGATPGSSRSCASTTRRPRVAARQPRRRRRRAADGHDHRQRLRRGASASRSAPRPRATVTVVGAGTLTRDGPAGSGRRRRDRHDHRRHERGEPPPTTSPTRRPSRSRHRPRARPTRRRRSSPRSTPAPPRRPARPRCDGPVAAARRSTPPRPAPHQFTVTATDANGVATSATVGYTVVAAAAGDDPRAGRRRRPTCRGSRSPRRTRCADDGAR